MNVFRILSSNDGSINEPNVSSFLAYLLDPNEDHGLSSLLLEKFLMDIIKSDNNFLSKIQFENKIADLSKNSNFSVTVRPEYSVYREIEGGQKKRRDIDIVIEVKDEKTGIILYSFCIENKITDDSINKKDTQLEEEIKGLQNEYSNTKNTDVFMIYLTNRPSRKSSESFSKLDYDKKIHLHWYDPNGKENSVFNKIVSIIEEGDRGQIDPINNQVSYLLKSFLSFIKTDFKSYIKEKKKQLEKRDYGVPVIDLLNDFSNTLDEKSEYEVKSIREDFSKYVLEKRGVEIKNNTRNAHISLATVNEKSRIHHNIDRKDFDRKNLFYYTDLESKKVLKLFSKEANGNVVVYFKGSDGELDSVNAKEISE
jgi:hypothetical protein